MKAEIIQNVLTFNSNGNNPMAVLLNNDDIELLESVFNIAEEVTTGENKDCLKTIIKEVNAFKMKKQAQKKEPADIMPTKAFFLLPNDPVEGRFTIQRDDEPEQAFMFSRDEVVSIAEALQEAIESLTEDKRKQKIITALHSDFSEALKTWNE